MNLETILNNEFLTNDEKSEAIIYWENNMRAGKFFLMKGKKKLWIMSIRSKFFKLDLIDDLIQKCQMKTINPGNVIEWIPYSKSTKYQIFNWGWIL